MKRFSLLFLALGAAVIFAGCRKEAVEADSAPPPADSAATDTAGDEAVADATYVTLKVPNMF